MGITRIIKTEVFVTREMTKKIWKLLNKYQSEPGLEPSTSRFTCLQRELNISPPLFPPFPPPPFSVFAFFPPASCLASCLGFWPPSGLACCCVAAAGGVVAVAAADAGTDADRAACVGIFTCLTVYKYTEIHIHLVRG